MKIPHHPEKRFVLRHLSTRWWTIGVLALAIAGLALFPTTVPDVWADRPENDRGREGDAIGPNMAAQNRESGQSVFPAVPPGGSRAAIAAPSTPDGLSVAHVELSDGRQQTTVIDVRTRTMAVYHITPQSGVITLKSVRNLGWDLQIDDYNSGKPQPREIRALVERR